MVRLVLPDPRERQVLRAPRAQVVVTLALPGPRVLPGRPVQQGRPEQALLVSRERLAPQDRPGRQERQGSQERLDRPVSRELRARPDPRVLKVLPEWMGAMGFQEILARRVPAVQTGRRVSLA